MGSDSEDGVGEVEVGIEDSNVLTKYKAAAEIANFALRKVIAELCDGGSVVELCRLGDSVITSECDKVFNKAVVDKDGEKKKIEKGIAFPTNVSPNNCACHLAPLEAEDVKINAGDLVKVDLGVQIDGYVATTAISVVVPQEKGSAPPAANGKISDLLQAAYTAAEVSQRLLRPGKTNEDVSEMIGKVAEQYGVNVVEGVLSHQMKQYVIDGNKTILAKPTDDQKVEKIEFANHEVYAIDLAFSSGDGKPKAKTSRTTIFKRRLDVEYSLKLKASRQVISEINSKFQLFPFALSALSDEKRGKLGIAECLNHDMVMEYPVLYDNPGEFIARIKYTALVMPNYTQCATVLEPPVVESTTEIEDQIIKDILAMPVGKPVTKKKKKSSAAEAST
mmetsp:Transcript_13464/g.24147  ORF Transcript_13464/g.24147 Transcript_13464/m.24147 type:complete len:391 (-) Transcript_13464:27-1199(-)